MLINIAGDTWAHPPANTKCVLEQMTKLEVPHQD